MVFRVFFFILLFMTNGTKEHLDEKNFRHCYCNFSEKVVLKVTWPQLCSKFFPNNCKAH